MSPKQTIKHKYKNKSQHYFLLLFMFYGLMLFPCFGQKLRSDTTLSFNFSDLSQNKASVLVFFDIDCPICQKYTKLLKEINEKYQGQGIKIYVVYPHKNIDPVAFKDFKTNYQFNLPIYFDKKQKLLHRLKGSVTPEVFLISNMGITVYHGAIDNWYYSLGKSRAQATENYLSDAIEALIKGESVRVSYHEPIGCAL
ncbi:redoxin domain-containing protein [Emticicia sp. BO119]|uniref:redoxin domain-containing protein n=1 Tax=Emticicia sp. BO119 TaxID=2757768 RepID=UPI0015F04EE2|nr:redoxin domain-containing protein [Emticicia sp. BO119]MBA4851170.1 redoxin domain-containing protein [Emticicia sp. BO119]